MHITTVKRALAVCLAIGVFAVGMQSALAQNKPKSGTVTIEQVNVALFWSASLGVETVLN